MQKFIFSAFFALTQASEEDDHFQTAQKFYSEKQFEFFENKGGFLNSSIQDGKDLYWASDFYYSTESRVFMQLYTVVDG
jgi:hypothetical protein